MASRQPAAGSTVYQLKITLRGSKPPIWRRVLVAGDATLHSLHWIIQTAMGWTNSHLHQFVVDGEYYSQPEFELGEWDLDVKNEKRIKLQALGLRPTERFVYEYDFGDSWDHEIVIEKVLEREAGIRYPRCVAGKRACPPEDCGGVWGYAEFVETIRNPDHPEHESMLEWAGGHFEPDEFDIEEVNQELQAIR